MAHRAHPARPKISAILSQLAQRLTGERVRLRDLTDALGDRAFDLLILVFALPNAVGLGTIPGVSTVFGLPQIFVALQLIVRPARLWLPDWLLERSIARADFVAMIDRIMPHLVRIECVLCERWTMLPPAIVERIAGVVVTILAVIQSLPIPFGNQPPAAAVALIALGLLARDGLFVALGFIAAIVATGIAAGVLFGGLAAVLLTVRHLFG